MWKRSKLLRVTRWFQNNPFDINWREQEDMVTGAQLQHKYQIPECMFSESISITRELLKIFTWQLAISATEHMMGGSHTRDVGEQKINLLLLWVRYIITLTRGFIEFVTSMLHWLNSYQRSAFLLRIETRKSISRNRQSIIFQQPTRQSRGLRPVPKEVHVG